MASAATRPRVWRYWLFLCGAVVFEVAGTCVMKMGQNGSIFSPEAGYGLMLFMIAISYYLLSLSTQVLPVGVAFAFWEGLGLTSITLASVVVLGESLTLGRVLALCAVLGGAMLIHHGTVGSDDEAASQDQPQATSSAGGVSC